MTCRARPSKPTNSAASKIRNRLAKGPVNTNTETEDDTQIRTLSVAGEVPGHGRVQHLGNLLDDRGEEYWAVFCNIGPDSSLARPNISVMPYGRSEGRA